jgi:hypothetical protein
VRVEGAAKGQVELEKDGWSLDARVKKNNAFFFVFIVPLKPNRFSSVGVFPVSGF